MFNPTPAIAGWFGYPLELEDRLRLIKAAGFKAVLLWWALESEFEPAIPFKVETARRHGLEVANAHLHFKYVNSLWEEGVQGEAYCRELCGLIESAGEYGVPTLVAHLTRTKEPPAFSELGFSRFMRLIDTAEKADVRLAFENLTAYERLYEFMAKVESPNAGVCFDSGHNLCHCPDRRVCRDFADKIIAVHLHDNHGKKDEHLIPFDGIEDWTRVREELAASAYTGPWSIEIEHPLTDIFGKSLDPDDPYTGMSAEEYLARAFAAHKRLIEPFSTEEKE